jgi:hypothetical protein
MNPILAQFIAGLAGVPEKDVLVLEEKAPEFGALCRSAQKLAPMLESADALLEKLAPQVDTMLPDLEKLFTLFKQINAEASPQKANFEAVAGALGDIVASKAN